MTPSELVAALRANARGNTGLNNFPAYAEAADYIEKAEKQLRRVNPVLDQLKCVERNAKIARKLLEPSAASDAPKECQCVCGTKRFNFECTCTCHKEAEPHPSYDVPTPHDKSTINKPETPKESSRCDCGRVYAWDEAAFCPDHGRCKKYCCTHDISRPAPQEPTIEVGDTVRLRNHERVLLEKYDTWEGQVIAEADPWGGRVIKATRAIKTFANVKNLELVSKAKPEPEPLKWKGSETGPPGAKWKEFAPGAYALNTEPEPPSEGTVRQDDVSMLMDARDAYNDWAQQNFDAVAQQAFVAGYRAALQAKP